MRRCRHGAHGVDPDGAAVSVADAQRIDGPEIHIARDEHLDPIALGLGDRGRNVDRAAQHLRHDVRGGRGTHDHRAAAVLGVHGPLDGAIDHGQIRIAAPKRSQKCRLTSPESPERPSSSVPGELKGTTTPVGVRASVHSTKMPRRCPAGPDRVSRRRASCRARAARRCHRR